MTIGEKIRTARCEKGMTQSDVAADKITRNMLSAIESDKALPSLDTLLHISSRLQLPVAYLLSGDTDPSLYKKNELIDDIRKAFAGKQYEDAIRLLGEIATLDDELSYIFAYSAFELGAAMARYGSFLRAEKYLSLAEEYSSKTIYDTSLIKCKIPLYMSFIKNVNSPLLDFDRDAFRRAMTDAVDYEFFKYVCNDLEYNYENKWFKKHVAAKIKIKERKYYEAISLLSEIADARASFEYNAYLLYCVYSDLDNCYKQVFDFENAYKYAEKRISMLEGFNS